MTTILTTPLGKIKVYADGACVDYKATEYSFNRHPCKDRPVAGCYRIEKVSPLIPDEVIHFTIVGTNTIVDLLVKDYPIVKKS